MGGEVNVYEVTAYREKYLKEVEPFIEVLVTELSLGKIGLVLEAQCPAEIVVGRGFYKAVVKFIVQSRSDLREKAKVFRFKTRSDLLAKTWPEQGKEISQKVSDARLAWWNRNPEAKEKYRKLAVDRIMDDSNSFGFNGDQHIEAHGRTFDSFNEILAFKALLDLNFLDIHDHVRVGTKVIDFYVADIGLWLEIDDMARTKQYFDDRVPNGYLAIVSVRPDLSYSSKLKEISDGIAQAVEDKVNSSQTVGTYFYGYDGGKRS